MKGCLLIDLVIWCACFSSPACSTLEWWVFNLPGVYRPVSTIKESFLLLFLPSVQSWECKQLLRSCSHDERKREIFYLCWFFSQPVIFFVCCHHHSRRTSSFSQLQIIIIINTLIATICILIIIIIRDVIIMTIAMDRWDNHSYWGINKVAVSHFFMCLTALITPQ